MQEIIDNINAELNDLCKANGGGEYDTLYNKLSGFADKIKGAKDSDEFDIILGSNSDGAVLFCVRTPDDETLYEKYDKVFKDTDAAEDALHNENGLEEIDCLSLGVRDFLNELMKADYIVILS